MFFYCIFTYFSIQLKSQKDLVIEEYNRLKLDQEDKQKFFLNSQIEKYKNESYNYKCERDEFKIQLNNLKSKKDGKDKEIDKIMLKCEKYKEKVADLEKAVTKYESEKREIKAKFHSHY